MTIISIHEKHNSLQFACVIVCGAYTNIHVRCTFIDHHKFLFYYVCYVLNITFNCITLFLSLNLPFTNYCYQQHKVTDNKNFIFVIIVFRYLIELNCLDWLTFDELYRRPLNYWRLSKKINFSIKNSSSLIFLLSFAWRWKIFSKFKLSL